MLVAHLIPLRIAFALLLTETCLAPGQQLLEPVRRHVLANADFRVTGSARGSGAM